MRLWYLSGTLIPLLNTNVPVGLTMVYLPWSPLATFGSLPCGAKGSAPPLCGQHFIEGGKGWSTELLVAAESWEVGKGQLQSCGAPSMLDPKSLALRW
jgi:hypothetical protein